MRGSTTAVVGPEPTRKEHSHEYESTHLARCAMLSTAATFTLDGISARRVRVEVDVHRGLPHFSVVGLPDAAARETRERVRAALVNCGFEFPLKRIVVNLAPASLRKVGPGMDLAIATALLAASGQLDWKELAGVALAGELALDGSTRPVQGALAMAEAAHEAGADAIVLPAENGAEAALAEGIRVIPVETLAQLSPLAAGEWEPPRPRALEVQLDPSPFQAPGLADLRGQPQVRQALEVAAAGAHSLLMVGPPGSGKSLAATRLPSILPPLLPGEALEVARIASACGRLGPGITGRPFRAPHHTISAAGLLGGGTPIRPGEATLAHRGVLFLDELGEFRRDALEALRAPLQTGSVSIARAGARHRLPCRFMLLAAANPCPCGRGEDDPGCTCAPVAARRYQARLSSTLANRIDALVALRQPSAEEIGGPLGESSAEVRERVCAARERQERRLGPGRCNAEMTSEEVRACPLSVAAATLLADSYARKRLSGISHDRVLRLARTLADLAEREEIGEEQMALALQLRRRDHG
jgi:magnesium chelatase family protein